MCSGGGLPLILIQLQIILHIVFNRNSAEKRIMLQDFIHLQMQYNVNKTAEVRGARETSVLVLTFEMYLQ